ncbi:putative Mn2 homeostasis protein [Talaromyces proteolyticus]|uniref:Post-GPI attachment to proteins factor 3 n=1 Tax=Talaromyces proteolyticus TaxID=1131652 RepID=A0AAD4KN53_9EURO|nr:putative Mn2 homeostasis protein [Talaromyces proteolyticus]KAH8695392.1 putative Mn2 homeostasis protein [Talaromyces proteolyticus]
MMALRCSLRSTIIVLALTLLVGHSLASIGDRLPDFKECVKICKEENCDNGNSAIPLHLRLMWWTCGAECDYTCQHVITDRRVNREFPMLQPIVQFHGKWPFYRVLGMQEIFSVVFSFLNLLAHYYGLKRIDESIPTSYPLRKYYVAFGYCGLTSWAFSMIFHARDFPITEKLDYWAAGASVLMGLFLAVIRIFRLDDQKNRSKSTIRRTWTYLCILLYVAHVSYLSLWSWDYTYNMIANIVIGSIQNVLWIVFSVYRYRKEPKKPWTAWPGLIVTWISLAMSLELLDFPPWWGLIDAHSLWHLGTVIPAAWWYAFIIKDAQDDMTVERLKA